MPADTMKGTREELSLQQVTVRGWRLTLSFIFASSCSCSCSGLPHRFIWEQSLWQYIKSQTLPFYCVCVDTARLKEGERQHEQLMCIYEETRHACSNRAAQRVTERVQGRGSVYRWALPLGHLLHLANYILNSIRTQLHATGSTQSLCLKGLNYVHCLKAERENKAIQQDSNLINMESDKFERVCFKKWMCLYLKGEGTK